MEFLNCSKAAALLNKDKNHSIEHTPEAKKIIVTSNYSENRLPDTLPPKSFGSREEVTFGEKVKTTLCWEEVKVETK
ncbi:hypothetical protein CEXT_480801 [Caerostris extrusa]|uniref:Uncharacterized protein n=1 Tax=Caerostris extrusa TaxID=172846 RepID=A0AAV4VZG9_CAEEX|nr:hypothetical protein CEXT_480801 [Caerostris extrusa]